MSPVQELQVISKRTVSFLSIFIYGNTEIQHLKSKDKTLGIAIDKIGFIERPVNPHLFSALIHSIVGQQISTKACQTVWGRMADGLGEISPATIDICSVDRLQGFGITFKKAGYIKNAAAKVQRGQFDIESLKTKTDEEVCRELSALDGIGIWTAEMLMTFSMQRPNVMSFGDLAIHRGLRMLYHHRKVNRQLFEKYKRRYSPYATVASLYLWSIAGGMVDGMKDYMPKTLKRK
ncbi:MAG: DNA-3-methyladenine glycosylase [Negativicutes bacterium]